MARHADGGGAGPADGSAAPGPWRDRGYLLFVLLDIPLNLDDSVLNVGLPLWLVHRTEAPHALVPAFLVVNTVLVVLLQLRVSAWAEGPHGALKALRWYGAALLACCLLLAASTGGGPGWASAALLAAAGLVTLAELLRSVSSWELAVSLAPPRARASYLGVAGMAQSVQKSVGPLLLTGVVTAAARSAGSPWARRRPASARSSAARACAGWPRGPPGRPGPHGCRAPLRRRRWCRCPAGPRARPSPGRGPGVLRAADAGGRGSKTASYTTLPLSAVRATCASGHIAPHKNARTSYYIW
ncbi:hypothetical protein ACFQ1I_45615 [Kitasatospora arboriphila]